MPTTYDPLLRIALQADGENNNTWGQILNDNTLELLAEAVGGLSSISLTSGNHTLTTNNGSTDEGRKAILVFTGSPGTNRTVTVPAVSHVYVVFNNMSTANTITFTTGSGTTVVLGQGKISIIFCDGTNVRAAVPTDVLTGADNLASITNAATARANLGLGALALYGLGSGLVINGANVDVTVSSFTTGDVMGSYATTKSGWVLLTGGTIGSATSGATLRANADTSALYTLLWDNVANAQLPIQDSSGVATTRGASAAADFAANKRLPVPDWRGRTGVGVDNMGGTAANRITNVFDGTLLGNSGGAERHQLTVAELAAHTHPQRINTGNGPISPQPGTGTNLTDVDPTTGSTGGDQPHNNTQPSITVNYFIKL